jgi:hypothetical protein
MYTGEVFDNIAKRLGNGYVSKDEEEIMIKYIKSIYAGPMAQGLFRGGFGWWLYQSDGGDLINAKTILRGLFKKASEAEIAEIGFNIRQEVMLLVNNDSVRSKTTALAELLVIKRRINYQECLEIINSL